MSEQVELIWYENLTRRKLENGKSSDAKQQPANSKQQTPKTEPAKKQPVKLAKD